jgi:hypothetical protein
MTAWFFDLIRDAIADGGWVVLRTAPNERVTAALAEANVAMRDEDPSADTSGDVECVALRALQPECQRMARWLVAEKGLRWHDIEQIVTSVREPSEDIVRIAYDQLQAHTRRTARVLATIRAPNHVNGRFGQLAWGDTSASWSVTRDAVGELRHSGFLQSDDALADGEIRMPRTGRQFVSTQASAIEGDLLLSLHEKLASIDNFAALSPEAQIEAHYHAAHSENVELAKRTARFYGTELSHLATRLSLAGKYGDAASLFEHVVGTFDATDAYAWEYFGYNLARCDWKSHEKGRHEDQIRRAYEQAHTLAPWNALYHGRWLGYRAERGENIQYEIEHALPRYLQRSQDLFDDAASHFIEAVFDGLRRGRQLLVRDAIRARWSTRLEEVAPRALSKHSSD